MQTSLIKFEYMFFKIKLIPETHFSLNELINPQNICKRFNYFRKYILLDDISNATYKEMLVVLNSSIAWILFKKLLAKFSIKRYN